MNKNTERTSESLIKLENITREFTVGNTTIKAVNNMSIDIKSGEMIAIIGTSGSGKSTLMSIIGCLDKHFGGKYFLDNLTVKDLNKDQLAELRNRKLGFIFQKYFLVPSLTVYENIELPLIYAKVPKKERKQKIENVLAKVNLSKYSKNLPSQLSGGQQQRVAIARAIINDPEIILADEPTGALDSETGKEIIEIIKNLNKEGKTTVLITHDLNIANQMERIIEISDGKIIRDSTSK